MSHQPEPKSRGGCVAAWLAFTGTLAGGLYFFVLAGLYAHEFIGHGLVAEACGGDFVAVMVSPHLTGMTWHENTPESLHWVVTAGGSTVNILIGLVALFFLLRRGRHLSPGTLLLFLLVAANFGQTLTYTFQGVLFERGDAGELSTGVTGAVRWRLTLAAGALLIGFLLWALHRLVFYAEEHFAPSTTRRRRLWLGAVLAPGAVVFLVQPLGVVFSAGQRIGFIAGLVAFLTAAVWWSTGKAPAGAEHRPLRAWHGVAWIMIAAAAWLATDVWLAEPLELG